MIMRISIMLLLALTLTGCANMILPQSNRIYEERTPSPATAHRSLVLSEPLDWFASENGDRYDIWLPQGTYRVQAEDGDYLYYEAPDKVALGKKKMFTAQDSMPQGGGIFFSKHDGTKYPSGAFVDFKDGEKLLVFYFDFRFTGQEGKRWHYVDE
jgi:hypothetical protein